MKLIDNYTTMDNMIDNEIYSFPNIGVDQGYYYKNGPILYKYHVDSKICYKYTRKENGIWGRRKIEFAKEIENIFSVIIMEGVL